MKVRIELDSEVPYEQEWLDQNREKIEEAIKERIMSKVVKLLKMEFEWLSFPS